MPHPIQAHFDAFQALLTGAGITAYDGQVPPDPAANYVLTYFYVETPDGERAPDAVDLVGDSDVVDAWAYVHCVGPTPSSARAMSGRVRAAVLNERLTIDGRTCFKVRWREGRPPSRNEEVPGVPVHDQVDVYGWRSVPV